MRNKRTENVSVIHSGHLPVLRRPFALVLLASLLVARLQCPSYRVRDQIKILDIHSEDVTNLRRRSLDISLVSFGISFGFANCCVREGLEVYGLSWVVDLHS